MNGSDKYPLKDLAGNCKKFSQLLDAAKQNEEHTLSKFASFSKEHHRFHGKEEDHRLPYKRDVDRIVHSKAYARYTDKTQVVYLVDNDHITHRGLHVQLVSNFARGIAEILNLNLDLVEAISLGHDVGHPPFGHEGERYLSNLAKKHGCHAFAHPLQSCRLFMEIEPLNLGFAIYDGFLCHDGGMKERLLQPNRSKTWEGHFQDCKLKQNNPNANIQPATIEGCLVKMCDTMSYIGKDIEDAISLGILKRQDVPETILGTNNRDILRTLAKDIISNSYDKDQIEISEEVYEAMKTLRQFNFRNIYTHPKLKVESSKIKNSYRILFETILEDYCENKKDSHIWNAFLFNKSESYFENNNEVQHIVDYIAGMTDSYFVRILNKLVVPTTIPI
ncbi:MAG: HD domain-containing protein [Chlamydiota bacterium]